MLLYVSATFKAPHLICHKRRQILATGINRDNIIKCRKPSSFAPMQIIAAASFGLILAVVVEAAEANTIEIANQQQQQQEQETLSNIPQELSSECIPGQEKDCNKKARIQRPKSRKAESCTSKCVGTCILGGYGSPGEGPLNVRKPLVVFKKGFRSRQYCLSECSDICNLIGDGDDGP